MARPTYSDDFKREATRLVTEQGLSRKRAARDLGVSVGALRDWLFRAGGDPAVPPELPPEEQLRRLRRENERLRMERDILKKAVGIFSQMPPQP